MNMKFAQELAQVADEFGLTEMEAKEALVHKGREKEAMRAYVKETMKNGTNR